MYIVFFRHCSEHQELSRQLQEAIDPGLTEDLERELDHVVARMEAKGEQIARLRRHQEKVRTSFCLVSRSVITLSGNVLSAVCS